MKTWLILACLLAPGAGWAITAKSLPRILEEVSRNSRPQAMEAIRNLQVLLANDVSEPLGITITESATLALGDPLPVVTVSIDRLRLFKKGTSAFGLLNGPDKVIYPILAGEPTNRKVRTSVIVDHFKGRWRIETLGGSGLISRLTEARARWKSEPGRDVVTNMLFAVQIPDLDTYFLADGAHGENWQLIPLEDKVQWHLKKGQAVEAPDLFLTLAFLLQ